MPKRASIFIGLWLKIIFWKYDWKVFEKSHLNILPSTSEAHHWQPPVRAERNQLFVRIIFNSLPQSFSITFHNYFQLFVRIDFYHLSELFSIICEIYLQLFVRFNWFQPFLQIISIASQNNTISFNYWANKAPITDVRYRNCNVIRPKMHLSPGTIFRAIANFECSHVRFEYFTLI